MIDFYLHKKKYTLTATAYNELSEKQLIGIAKVLMNKPEKELAEIKILQILLNTSKLAFFAIPLDAKAKMIEHIQWVFEDKNLLTKQIIPSYNGFYGPASEWDNLTMKEWNSCEVYYELMAKEELPEALDSLVAVLYRKPKFLYNKSRNKDGDIRKPFNPNETEYYSLQIARWPLEIKFAILMWYDGCREYLVNNYDVFDSNTTNTEKTSSGMFELIRGLCGTKYGMFEQVEQLNVHVTMRELELQKQEAAQLLSQHKI